MSLRESALGEGAGAEWVNERSTGKINLLLELYASLTPIILRMRTM